MTRRKVRAVTAPGLYSAAAPAPVASETGIMRMTRSVLLFGESNTHGTRPMPDLDFQGRFGREERWTGRLAKLLPDWEVIAEGHPGRTTVHDDPVEGEHRNGLTVLPALLESHRPIDVVLVMLGTELASADGLVGTSGICLMVPPTGPWVRANSHRGNHASVN